MCMYMYISESVKHQLCRDTCSLLKMFEAGKSMCLVCFIQVSSYVYHDASPALVNTSHITHTYTEAIIHIYPKISADVAPVHVAWLLGYG